MAKTRKDKEVIFARLKDVLTKAGNAVFVHFKGMPVLDERKLRGALRDEGIAYFVAKKTLIKKAIGESGLGEVDGLDGEVAVAYSTTNTDPTKPARLIHEFAKKIGAEKLVLLGGIFEQSLHSKESIRDIATIPTIDVLRGMFVNVINSPIQGVVVALNAIAQKKN